MKALHLLFIALFIFAFSKVRAQDAIPYGLQCASTSSADLKNCLKKESGKIDEANLPNEVILSTDSAGKESLIKMVAELTADRADPFALELAAKLPMIEEAIATALIIQYEDEPQLYYYIVDKNGKLEVIFDGLNSVDISQSFAGLFLSDPEIFSLKAPVSDNFKEWMKHLKESN